jgi:hypothetical protein
MVKARTFDFPPLGAGFLIMMSAVPAPATESRLASGKEGPVWNDAFEAWEMTISIERAFE